MATKKGEKPRNHLSIHCSQMDKMMRSQGGGGVAGEYQYYYHGGTGVGGLVDQEMAVAAPPSSDDGVVLLMELLDGEEEMGDDYSPSPAATTDGDGDADQLSRVIRSLEAEIGGGGATGAVAAATATRDSDESMAAAGPASDDDGAAAAGIRRLEDMFSDDLDGYGGGAFGYGWPPELALPAAASWCVYDDEHLYYGDGSIDDQVYSPLWEQ